MRGVAVICAAVAGWVAVVGLPRGFAIRLPGVAPRFVAVSIVVLAGSAMILNALLGVLAAALAISVILASVPLALSQKRRIREAAAHRDRWPDVLMHVRSSVAAGATLGDALIDALEATDDRFAVAANTLRNEITFGGGFDAAVLRIRSDEDDPTTDRILVALAAAARTGGTRVGELIAVLARSVGGELRLRKAHDAAMTEQRLTINVALVAPWALLALSIATNPQARDAFSTVEGSVVIAIGFVATVIGWLMAVRTSRLRRQPRVFR